MANLFGNLSTPQYLGPEERSLAAAKGAGDAGQLFGAALRQKRGFEHDKEMAQNDPLIEMKRLQFKTQLAESASRLADSELSRRMKQNQIDSEAADKLAFTKILTSAKGDDDAMLNALGETQWQSPMGRDNATQLRLATVARKSRDAFSKALAKMTPQGIARVSKFEAGSVEAWNAIEEEEKAAKPQSTFGKLLADRAAASDTDKPLFDQQIAAMGAKEGISIQFDDQGRPIINYGPGATGIGKPTVASQTQVQQKLMKYENSMELMTQLEKGLRPEHVGIAGAAGEILLDRTLAQFVPGAADTNRIQARTALIAAKEGLMREISDDPRFSNRDREEISKALPSSGVFESYPDAMTRIQTVKQILSNRGKVYSSGLGLKPPVWSMSKEEIREAFQKKELTEDEAIKALQRFHRD